MAGEIITNFVSRIIIFFQNYLPKKYQPLFIIASSTIIISLYAIFIWKFYRFLAKRDLLELNLRKFNKSKHPFATKFFGSFLYLFEYIVILPIMVFIWFSILSLFLLILSSNQDVAQILLISAGIVAAVRFTSYFSEDLSKDLAKIFPFTILAVFLLNPSFFSLQKLINRISEIPFLVNHIFVYLLFIIGLEALMRLIFLFGTVFSSKRARIENIIEEAE